MQQRNESSQIEIFCCYAREDLALFHHLEKHLAAFKREGLATLWADNYLEAGATWEETIHQHLDTAQIVLFLISSDFLNSDACFREMERALAREQRGETRAIPILLRPVNWEQTPFGKLQMLPSGAKAIESQHWLHRDEALEEVTRGIREVITSLLAEQESRHQAELARRKRRVREKEPARHLQAQARQTTKPRVSTSTLFCLVLRYRWTLLVLFLLLSGTTLGIASWYNYQQVQVTGTAGHTQVTGTTGHTQVTGTAGHTNATATAISMQATIAYNKAVAKQGTEFGFDATHSHNNPYERLLSPQSITRLKPFWTATTGSGIHSSPVVANGVVFVGSLDDKLYAFSASGCGHPPCAPLWTATTGGSIESSPAIANGIVFVGSLDDRLYAFSANGCGHPSCDPLWTATTGNNIRSSPAIANGIVFVGSHDDKLYAFSANGCGHPSCTPLWTATTGGSIESSPAIANGIVFVGSLDDRLYTFSLNNASSPDHTRHPLGGENHERQDSLVWARRSTNDYQFSAAVCCSQQDLFKVPKSRQTESILARTRRGKRQTSYESEKRLKMNPP